MLDKTISGLMLKKTNGLYWKKEDVYEDCIEATRYLIAKFRAIWCQHI